MSDGVFSALRRFFSGGCCPKPGCIGECAAASVVATRENGKVRVAYCYIWDAEFDDSEAVANVVIQAGGQEPMVSWTLYDGANGDRKGFTEEGTRAWTVSWFEPTEPST